MDNVNTTATVETYQDLAGLVDYSLTRTDLSEEDIARGCEIAKSYGLAAVIVRPCDVDLAARWVGSLRLASIVDVPFGYSTTSAKTFAARDLLRRGVKEIETVMNTGKLISRQFQYIEVELHQIAESCRESQAILKVHLESEHLNEELKIVACRIAKRAGVDYLATGSLEDVPLLQTHVREKLKLKATASIEDLETARAFRSAGCTRIQLTNPRPILDAWKVELAARQQQVKANSGG